MPDEEPNPTKPTADFHKRRYTLMLLLGLLGLVSTFAIVYVFVNLQDSTDEKPPRFAVVTPSQTPLEQANTQPAEKAGITATPKNTAALLARIKQQTGDFKSKFPQGAFHEKFRPQEAERQAFRAELKQLSTEASQLRGLAGEDEVHIRIELLDGFQRLDASGLKEQLDALIRLQPVLIEMKPSDADAVLDRLALLIGSESRNIAPFFKSYWQAKVEQAEGSDSEQAAKLRYAKSVAYLPFGQKLCLEGQQLLRELKEAYAKKFAPDPVPSLRIGELIRDALIHYDPPNNLDAMHNHAKECRDALGDDHPMTMEAELYTGSRYLKMARFNESFQAYEKTLKYLKSKENAKNPATLTKISDYVSAAGLARFEGGIRGQDDSRELLAYALKQLREVYGPHHPATLKAFKDFLDKDNSGYNTDARFDYHLAVIETYGPNSSEARDSAYLFASLYCKEVEYERGNKLLESMRPTIPETGLKRFLDELVQNAIKWNRTEDANKYQRELDELAETTLPKHERISVLESRIKVLLKQGKLSEATAARRKIISIEASNPKSYVHSVNMELTFLLDVVKAAEAHALMDDALRYAEQIYTTLLPMRIEHRASQQYHFSKQMYGDVCQVLQRIYLKMNRFDDYFRIATAAREELDIPEADKIPRAIDFLDRTLEVFRTAKAPPAAVIPVLKAKIAAKKLSKNLDETMIVDLYTDLFKLHEQNQDYAEALETLKMINILYKKLARVRLNYTIEVQATKLMQYLNSIQDHAEAILIGLYHTSNLLKQTSSMNSEQSVLMQTYLSSILFQADRISQSDEQSSNALREKAINILIGLFKHNPFLRDDLKDKAVFTEILTDPRLLPASPPSNKRPR